LVLIKGSADKRSTERGTGPHVNDKGVMEEIFRTTDLVKLSFACHLLNEAGVEHFVADQFMSALEGGIAAFPRRVMVASDDAARGRRALAELESDGAYGAT